MARPNIQIDDVVREMTDEEYTGLLVSGWTEEVVEPAVSDVAEPSVTDAG